LFYQPSAEVAQFQLALDKHLADTQQLGSKRQEFASFDLFESSKSQPDEKASKIDLDHLEPNAALKQHEQNYNFEQLPAESTNLFDIITSAARGSSDRKKANFFLPKIFGFGYPHKGY